MNSLNSKEAGPGRRRGRPRGGASADHRNRLMDIAETRFAQQGFMSTSVRELADEAGVNPAMVHYYFGNKHGLLIAVLDRAFEPLARAIAELGKADSIPIENLTGLLYETFGRHPALPHLIVREVMLTSGDLREHFLQTYAPRLGAALPPILAREQERGAIAGACDPRMLTVSILGLCVFPFVARDVMSPALGLEFGAGEQVEMLAQVNHMLKSGVLA